MNDNLNYIAIDTDQSIASILSNFSDDFIDNIISESLVYKFRPYGTRMANYPYVMEQQFKGIYDNYLGSDTLSIAEKRLSVYNKIIDILCSHYQLAITTEIPDEIMYSLCYTMYQILVCEFTERLIGFYSQYIVNHKDEILASMSDEQKTTKSTYTKKMYNDQSVIIIYENFETVLDMISGLDIPFQSLLELVSDSTTAGFISSYITDCGDIYKNYFASYVRNPITRTDMITSIKIRFVDMTSGSMDIINSGNNPCII